MTTCAWGARIKHLERRLSFDAETYAQRNAVVERCVARLKQWRGMATGYEKQVTNYRALVL